MTTRSTLGPLTPEQTYLADLYVHTDNLLVSQIADLLVVSEGVVRLQLREICRQIGVPFSRRSLRAYMATVELAPGGDR